MWRSVACGVLAAALAVGLCVAPDPSVAQEEPRREESRDERLSGTFVLAEPFDRARARVHAAIDHAADQVNFLIRGWARGRLREKNPIHRRIRTRVDDDVVVVIYDEDRYESRDGRWRTVMATGEEVRLLQVVRENRIYQRFVGGDGEKRMVLTFAEDAPWLWLDVTVLSDRLAEPLRYRLTFREAQEPSSRRASSRR
jgi:hypothetical protein